MGTTPARRRGHLTLGRVFLLVGVGVTLLLAALFAVLLRGWRVSIMDRARSLREEASRTIGVQVEAELYQGQRVLEDVEKLVRLDAVRAGDRVSLESSLFAQVVTNPRLAEVTFTVARASGTPWQLAVVRILDGGRIVTRYTALENGHFAVYVRDRSAGGPLLEAPLELRGNLVANPTEHPTFRTTVSAPFYGRTLWTDLHWSELDADLPPGRRRVEVAVLKAIEDREGAFLGVLRVGLLTEQVDELTRRESAERAPHVVFICDEEGRLVSRLAGADRLREEGDGSLRVDPATEPPEVRLAVAEPMVRAVRAGHPVASGQFVSGGRRFLATFRELERTQGWRLGILVPEDYYLGGYLRTRDRTLAGAALILAAMLVIGGAAIRATGRGLGRVVEATQRMAGFDFSAAEPRSPFRDVEDVMRSLELAKTALRALGRYVPVELVRELYRTGREPVLGGETAEVTMMFTDVKDFTSLSEDLTPDELARLLGRYLQAMTEAVHQADGVIDKYVGDAVMAVWNAVRPCADHAEKACRAALASCEATRRLYESPEWGGRPALHTRFGVHVGRVMVGHFGAPNRMSFTVLGDGVNLASRLEGLNKQYGTTILVSDTVRLAVGSGFAFRLLDKVAVKGRREGVRVYELLGESRAVVGGTGVVAAYEQALAAYWRRDFEAALALFESQGDDGPSRVLAARCRLFLTAPPPPEWNGIHIATDK
jgi:adenylate cyclase